MSGKYSNLRVGGSIRSRPDASKAFSFTGGGAVEAESPPLPFVRCGAKSMCITGACQLTERFDLPLHTLESIRVQDGEEVQWVRVEILVGSETGEDHTLLEASFLSKPIVIADAPTICVNLGRSNTDFSREFDDIRIPANRFVGLVEFLGGDLRLHAVRKLNKGPNGPIVVLEVE